MSLRNVSLKELRQLAYIGAVVLLREQERNVAMLRVVTRQLNGARPKASGGSVPEAGERVRRRKRVRWTAKRRAAARERAIARWKNPKYRRAVLSGRKRAARG